MRTCRAPPQLQRFDLSSMSDLGFLLFLSLSRLSIFLSIFLSPTDTHPPLSLFLSTCHYPIPPRTHPVLTKTRTPHAVENNVSESHLLGATGSITRLSRLPVGFIYRKDTFLTRIIFLCIVRLISFLHDSRDCLRVFYT